MRMLNREELKARAFRRIDQHRDWVLEIVGQIYREPEIGYREQRTAKLVGEAFDRLGLPHQDGLAITGAKAELRGGGGAGPSISIMGELDALIVPDHRDAHPERQTAHACG